jgi:ribonuclease HI
VDHVNITHQVLEEGIDNTFILENSLFLDEEKKEGSWGLDFDGAHSSTGSGAGIVLRSPDNETTLFSYRLEFNCTNNIFEYEALILGINLAIDMNIKTLHVKGDSDLIVSQVNKKFVAKNPRLKQYRDVVWDAIKKFDNFSIEAIPREENHLADNLVVSASTLQLFKEIGLYKVEVNYRPSLPDNLEHWQVFDNESQILCFLQNEGEFSEAQINLLAEKVNIEIIDIADEPLPKGIVPLEDLFDRNDMYKGKPSSKINDEIIEFNIGTEESPKMIKFGKGTTTDEREKLISLIREFKDVFAWSYEDLKAYHEDVIQHAIPLIDGTKPFRQKLRQMNPKVSPQVQKELQKMVEAGIIEPIIYSSWVSNPVIVRKKTGEIRICVDFINLNRLHLRTIILYQTWSIFCKGSPEQK